MKRLAVFGLLLIWGCQTQKCQDKAQVYFEIQLEQTRRWVTHDFKDRKGAMFNAIPAVYFLETKTGIKPSDGKLFDNNYPSIQDYEKWSEWYKQNKERVYWDKDEEKIVIRD